MSANTTMLEDIIETMKESNWQFGFVSGVLTIFIFMVFFGPAPEVADKPHEPEAVSIINTATTTADAMIQAANAYRQLMHERADAELSIVIEKAKTIEASTQDIISSNKKLLELIEAKRNQEIEEINLARDQARSQRVDIEAKTRQALEHNR